ncbi:hypothetical protein HPULCUR_000536 [Helicostylum pulchrum]|uniref:Uncharacterized protein n=1 Tax=Helicostylum pulchrum TaxID=562976 RepID=A0ABP9XK60_9FUNG
MELTNALVSSKRQLTIEGVIRGELVQSLASKIKILNGAFIQVNYKAKSRYNIIQAIYEEAATITLNIQAIIQGIVFVKIAISNCLNEMNTLFRQRLATDLILHHQQSKNIRTNATVLDDMIRITSGESLHSIYMDCSACIISAYPKYVLRTRCFSLDSEVFVQMATGNDLFKTKDKLSSF